MMDLGQKIKKLRKEKAMTQQRLAEEMGVDIKTVQRIEQGKVRNPERQTLLEMAKVLEIELSEITNCLATSKEVDDWYLVNRAEVLINSAVAFGAFSVQYGDVDVTDLDLVDCFYQSLIQYMEERNYQSAVMRADMEMKIKSAIEDLKNAGYVFALSKSSVKTKILLKEIDRCQLSIAIVKENILHNENAGMYELPES